MAVFGGNPKGTGEKSKISSPAMTEPAPAPQGQTCFSAVLTPHRSLGPKGFMVLMGAVCAVSFGTGLLFYLLGAWPVIGFMGLDVALIYIAFKLNFRELRLGRSSQLSLASHGRRLVFASFLTDDEREDFALALSAALSSARSPGAA